MAYSPLDVRKVESDIQAASGLVVHRGADGRWMIEDAAGLSRPAPDAVGAAFEESLRDLAANRTQQQATRAASRITTQSAAPFVAPPNAPRRFGRVGGAVSAVIGGALGGLAAGAQTQPPPGPPVVSPPGALSAPTPTARGANAAAQNAPSAFGRVGGVIGGVTGGVLAGGIALGGLAAGAAALNVRGAATATGNAAQSVAAGAGRVVTGAFGAGVAIGQSILDGLAQHFGPGGVAVAQFAGQVAHTIGDVLQGAVRGAADLAGHVGHAVGAVGAVAAGVGGAVVGAGLGAVGGMGGAALGGLLGGVAGTFAGLLGARLIGAVGNIVGGILGIVGRAVSMVGELAATGIRTLTAVLHQLTETIGVAGGRMATLTMQIGASAGAAAGLATRFNALGMGSTLEGITGNSANQPAFYGMRSRFFGLPDYTAPDFIPQAAARMQAQNASGPLGVMRSQMMAESLGMGGVEAQRVLAIAPERLRAQQQSVSGFSAGLGLNPGVIREVSDGVYLLQKRFESFLQLGLLRIAQEALPYLTSVLERVSNYVTSHADAIAGGIMRGVKWLVEDLPPMVLRGFAGIATGLGTFLLGVADFTDGVRANLPTIMGALDGFLNGLRDFAGVVAGIAGAVAQGVRNFQARLGAGLTVTPNTTPPGAPNTTPGATVANASAPGAPTPPAPIDLTAILNRAAPPRRTSIQGGLFGWTPSEAGAAGAERRRMDDAAPEGAWTATKTLVVGGAAVVGALRGATTAATLTGANPYAVGAGAIAGGAGAGYLAAKGYDFGAPIVNRIMNAGRIASDVARDVYTGDTGALGARSLPDAFNQSRENFMVGTSPFNLKDRYGSPDGPLGSRLGSATDTERTAARALLDGGKSAEGMANNWGDVIKELRDIKAGVNRTAENAGRTASNMNGFAQGIVARTAAYIAEDTAASILRGT